MVVVLPTPPFWFATAITRGSGGIGAASESSGSGAGSTGAGSAVVGSPAAAWFGGSASDDVCAAGGGAGSTVVVSAPDRGGDSLGRDGQVSVIHAPVGHCGVPVGTLPAILPRSPPRVKDPRPRCVFHVEHTASTKPVCPTSRDAAPTVGHGPRSPPVAEGQRRASGSGAAQRGECRAPLGTPSRGASPSHAGDPRPAVRWHRR